jgi:hypothetical protein
MLVAYAWDGSQVDKVPLLSDDFEYTATMGAVFSAGVTTETAAVIAIHAGHESLSLDASSTVADLSWNAPSDDATVGPLPDSIGGVFSWLNGIFSTVGSAFSSLLWWLGVFAE